MSAAIEIVRELRELGVRVEPRPSGGIRLVPAHLIDPLLLSRIHAHKAEVINQLRANSVETESIPNSQTDELSPNISEFDDSPSSHPVSPACSIVSTCRKYGVFLRIDPQTGDLVLGKEGAKTNESTQPWPSLIRAVEAHIEALAEIVESGWTLHCEFPEVSRRKVSEKSRSENSLRFHNHGMTTPNIRRRVERQRRERTLISMGFSAAKINETI